jgi:hypothetical protein
MVLLVYVGTVIHLFKLHPYRKIPDAGDPLWDSVGGPRGAPLGSDNFSRVLHGMTNHHNRERTEY